MNKDMISIGIKARKALEIKVSTKIKNKVLNDYAKAIDKKKNYIIKENLKDIKFTKAKGIKKNLIDRLKVDNKKLIGIKKSIEKIVRLKDNVDFTIGKWNRQDV